MKLRFKLTIGVLFLLAGGLLDSQHFLNAFETKNAQPFIGTTHVSAAAITPTTPNLIIGTPSHISIPSQHISVDVDPGRYNASKQTWSLSETKAEFATVTTQPNNIAGNTFIYGHDIPAVFESLLKAHIGDQAVVTTSNGHTFTYTLANYHDTKPSDVSLFNYQGKPILTLQTCSGFWYQNRRLFVFNLSQVN
jgi:LPXTG-site transpeptidase (sortase) family protein